MKKSLPLLCALVSWLGLSAQERHGGGFDHPPGQRGECTSATRMDSSRPNGAKETKVALEVNTRLFKGLKGNVLDYQVQASKEVIRFTLPNGPVTGIVEVRNKGQLEMKLKEVREENWIGEYGLRLVLWGKSPPANRLTGRSALHRALGLGLQTAHLDHSREKNTNVPSRRAGKPRPCSSTFWEPRIASPSSTGPASWAKEKGT